jgi:hypothetical protein
MWFAKLFGEREDDSEPSEHPPHPASNAPKATPTNVRPVIDKVEGTPKKATAKKGFDPYNSGTFDRNQAWQRVIR